MQAELAVSALAPIRFFLRATQGLEDVAADELGAIPGVRVEAIRHRTVCGETSGSLAALLTLRSADDVFLELGRFDGMERARVALALLAERASALDPRPALEAVAAVRPLPPRRRMSVSVSFVGRRNYTTDELKDVLARTVVSRLSLAVEPDDREAPLHLRLVLEHGAALLGLRLGRLPLHERSWKRAHVAGSLKPSVAAALWRLAGLVPGARALDVCCGAGTFLAEAALAGASSWGGDRDAAALWAAASNLRPLALAAFLARWDACALPLAARCMHSVVSNLPWGRQVGSEATLVKLHQELAGEVGRVLVPGGRVALLTAAPERFAPGTLRLDERREIGLSGQRPSVLVLTRVAEAT